MNKVVIFLADGCEEIEALTPIDVLRRGGVDVIGVSISGDKVIKGAHGINFMADDIFDNIDFDAVDMAVLPGGLIGRNNLMAHKGVNDICLSFSNKGKYIAAICASPSVIGEIGILNGKRAICYPCFESQLKGAVITDENVVKDGNIITSKGPGTALEFSLALLETIKGRAVSESVAAGMLYK